MPVEQPRRRPRIAGSPRCAGFGFFSSQGAENAARRFASASRSSPSLLPRFSRRPRRVPPDDALVERRLVRRIRRHVLLPALRHDLEARIAGQRRRAQPRLDRRAAHELSRFRWHVEFLENIARKKNTTAVNSPTGRRRGGFPAAGGHGVGRRLGDGVLDPHVPQQRKVCRGDFGAVFAAAVVVCQPARDCTVNSMFDWPEHSHTSPTTMSCSLIVFLPAAIRSVPSPSAVSGSSSTTSGRPVPRPPGGFAA